MSPPHPHRGFLGSRLARRLFALFVVASLLPLALSGWLSTTAVTQIAESLNLRSSAQTTRQTSRQVFDRLMAGKTLLAAAPHDLQAPEPGSPQARPPGLGSVFRKLALLGPDGLTVWSSDATPELARAWAAADAGVPPGKPLPHHKQGNGVEVQLRALVPAGEPPRQLLAAAHQGVLRWIAELDPAYLWAPVNDATDDSAWQVLDARGRTLTRFQGADFRPTPAPAAGGVAGEDSVESRSVLFLAGEFAADDWVFVQRGPRPQVRWQGALLTVWLGLVAVGTLLAIALLGQWQIRRTLIPLEQLTEGARQLAAGASGTRVAIRRDDEIGTLAGAFNDMAAHVEAQFDALEGLAAIDRDVLAGAPLLHLAERVVQRLTCLYPGACAAVSWREGEASLEQSLLPREGEAVIHTTLTLSAAQAEAYGRLAQDGPHHGDAPTEPTDPADEPWRPAGCPPVTGHPILLPLRRQDHTEALIVLGLPTTPTDEQLQPARELRDRLAVAFAAHAREHELVYRAAHDSLTGLANRYGLHKRLDTLLGDPGNPPRSALLFVDLDHFKDVNDRHGHEAGDALLCLAGSRLQACIPPGALVARQGGDEFAIVLPQADEALAGAVAAQAIRSLSQSFPLRDGEHVLGASVGIALSPTHGTTREALLRSADIALYAAKGAGRGQHVLFTTALDAATRERVQLLAELRRALERGEFVAHYQPRVRPHDGVVTSAEALIRWQHPERGLLFPGAFIALAESSGLIDGIGRWILDAACAQMAAWRRQGVPVERISVNVSPHQLASGDLPAQVRDALDRHALPGDALELEVTESLLVGDASAACVQLSQLREWGITVALDDFGTGYSSLSTLRQLPIDVMKIDRSFVTDLGRDDGAIAVTHTIIALARSLRLKLVAEGIETETQADVLRSMGCDELQGYLFSKPVSPEQFVRLPGLRAQHASRPEHRPDDRHADPHRPVAAPMETAAPGH